MLTIKSPPRLICILAVLLAGAPAANAQWAVIDVGAIAQLVQEVQTMQQALTTAQGQLQQAQQAYQSMTGARGMERLLSGTVRNYLPSDWNQLTAAMNQTGSSALAAAIRSAVSANAILNAQQVGQLSPTEQSLLRAQRQSTAMLQGIASQALATTSNRFASVQQLINAIPSAADQKAILDLQARIQAEQGMLQNENTKLQVLYAAADAEERAWKQRVSEQAIADIGSMRRLPPLGL